MKNFTKSLKTSFLLLLIGNLAQGQDASQEKSLYEKGNVLIDAYYGYPNLLSGYFKTAINEANSAGYTGFTVSSIGPLGGRAEYILSRLIGVGADFSYANTTIKYTDPNTSLNYQASIPRWRIVPRVNLHLGRNTKLDPYFAFGFGYSNYKVTYKTNDPNYVGPTLSQILPIDFSYVIMAKFGMRYFLNENFGLGFELGLGGPLATAGATVKF